MHKMRKRTRRVVCILLVFLALPVLLLVAVVGLFAANGLLLADGETVRVRTTSHAAGVTFGEGEREITIVSFNIAKLFLHKGGLSFAEPERVRQRLRRAAQVIQDQEPDLVFLSEAVRQCSACPVDQVAEMAEATGMHTWAFGENYNFGLPFYRIVGGNAILSRWPLEPVRNQTLAGRKPFWITKNNRRALWCAMAINGKRILLAAVHNDSYNIRNNLAQTRQLLEFAGGRPTVIAGDFNANPDEPPMVLLNESGRFAGVFNGPKTFPSSGPEETIDFILAPATWQVVDHRVIKDPCSDHCAVCTVFRVPQ
jgi:endonuclease/exonuclease/phosphatase family metal-dependent hydrolase